MLRSKRTGSCFNRLANIACDYGAQVPAARFFKHSQAPAFRRCGLVSVAGVLWSLSPAVAVHL